MEMEKALIEFFMDAAKASREDATEAAQALVSAQKEGRLTELLRECGVAGLDPIG